MTIIEGGLSCSKKCITLNSKQLVCYLNIIYEFLIFLCIVFLLYWHLMLFGCKYISRGCIQVSMSVEEVLCEVLKHPKVTMLNLEQVEPPGHRVGRECDLVTAHLRTSAASSCVTMTQHHSHTDSRHREHTQEQSQSV